MRASPEIPATERRTMVNCPVSTVMLYSSMAQKIVQPTGNRPKAAPLANDHRVWSTGMP